MILMSPRNVDLVSFAVGPIVLPLVLVSVMQPSCGQLCSKTTTADPGDNIATLRAKTIASFRAECRVSENRQSVEYSSDSADGSLTPTYTMATLLDSGSPDSLVTTNKYRGYTTGPQSCAFTTIETDPASATPVLKPLTMPFRLDFSIRTVKAAGIALSEDETTDSIFADINLGGSQNTKSVMRSCWRDTCTDKLVIAYETGLLNANEFRPFWIDYRGGVVKVGKGGQESAFLEWDAGAFHRRVPAQVRVLVSSWGRVDVDWLFHQFCE